MSIARRMSRQQRMRDLQEIANKEGQTLTMDDIGTFMFAILQEIKDLKDDIQEQLEAVAPPAEAGVRERP